MAFILVKCPDCGNETQVDNSKDIGFCMNCGSKITIPKLELPSKSDKFDNYIVLSENALQASNGQEAYDYATYALEIKPRSSLAWFLKMKAISKIATIGNLRTAEILTCGNNAISFANLDEKVNMNVRVKNFYLQRAYELLTIATERFNDTNSIERTFKTLAISNIYASKETLKLDTSYVNMIDNLCMEAVELKSSVSLEEFSTLSELQRWLDLICRQYICATDALQCRYSVYGASLNDEAIKSRNMILDQLKIGLIEDKNKDEIIEIVSKKKSGCYIATAIYGSYNTPEVLIFRKFRDNVLFKNIFGRIFIKVYYSLSPHIAAKIKKKGLINSAIKFFLDKFAMFLRGMRF